MARKGIPDAARIQRPATIPAIEPAAADGGGILSFAALPAQAQSVTFDGESFVNKGLVAVARLPADAKDKQGDTLGGIGSGMAADLGAWKRDGDSYTGTLYMVPDRGWNTEGTLDFQGRVQVFDVKLAARLRRRWPEAAIGAGPHL